MFQSPIVSSLAFALAFSTACGSQTEAPDLADSGTAGSDIVAEIGTGTTEFAMLVDDQELQLIAGVQGGYHFLVHARSRNLQPGDPARPGLLENPITSFFMFREDGTRIDIGNPPYRLGYREVSDGWYELLSGRILQIDENLQEDLVPDIFQERVRLRLEIEDSQGKRATAEHWIRPISQSNSKVDSPATRGLE